MPSYKAAIRRTETLEEGYHLLERDLFLCRLDITPGKELAVLAKS